MNMINYNKGPVGETFNFFGLDLIVDNVSFNVDDLIFDHYQRFCIEAHTYKNDARNENPFGIKRVIFNGPATIVFWLDGTKTVVKRAKGTKYDRKTAILWAYAKKMCGTSSHMNKVLDKFVCNPE